MLFAYLCWKEAVAFMIKKTTTIFLLCLMVKLVAAQISTDRRPYSMTDAELDGIHYAEIKNTQERPNRSLPANYPLYAGYTLDFNAELLGAGRWEKSSEGMHIWRLGIRVAGADKLNIYFRNIRLGADEYLFIYDPEYAHILGGYSQFNNGEFMGTELLKGDKLVLEFNSSSQSHTLPFQISELGVVTHSGREAMGGFGEAGSCEVPINCTEGNDWQDQKGGIARVFVKEGSSLFWCSGSLVNNTRNDGKPYFLTANHCGQFADDADYANWVFYFNYEGTYCERPLNEPESQSISGASLLAKCPTATSSGSDFKLLLLNDEVPPESRPYYNGWDRSGAFTNHGVGIHHPQGDIKMISTFSQPTISSQYYGEAEDDNGYYWKVNWSETDHGHGVTEGGSSGAPLFNEAGLIVGALTGGKASCSNVDGSDYYGKFSLSWDNFGADSSSQLKVWLDPDNIGLMTLEGSNLDSVNILAYFTAENPNIRRGEQLQFSNLSLGNIESHIWYFEGGNPEHHAGENPPPVYYGSAGDFDVQLIVKSATNSDTLMRHNYVHVSPSIYPNPGKGLFRIKFGNKTSTAVSLTVFDILGRNLSFDVTAGEGNDLILDLSTMRAGIYFVHITSDTGTETQKIILSN